MTGFHHASSSASVLHKAEFEWIKKYLYEHAGIVLNDSKHALVVGRLEKRLRHFDLKSYKEYFSLFGKPGYESEATIAVDLLTTNETYFFREPRHFDFLTQQILPQHAYSQPMRIWSGASSSGEEAYTLAMLLGNQSKISNWEIIGTDISTRILDKARRGLYPGNASEKIPPTLLKKFCFKGTGDYEGLLLIDPALRKRVKFIYANLIDTLPELGVFDVIFLRNVMIYFDMDTKERLVQRVSTYLRPGGYFFCSHSESLNGMKVDLQLVTPSIYRKPK